MRFLLLLCPPLLTCSSFALVAEPADYFAIQVVDEQTGRGVPLVELRTTNDILHVTDSAGYVAFDEPGLMGKEVYFSVKSHGYEYPKDGFGFRGVKLKPTPGGSATLKIKRLNVAERLYRLTGAGIYRDSVLLGKKPPIVKPLLNGLVTGQDSAHATVYRSKLFWIWGDTNRAAYPLGNFAVSGATAELPAKGGLNPDAGVNLRYFVDEKGFSRPMVPPSSVAGPGPIWLGGLITIKDKGKEKLIAKYSRMKNLGETYERGLVIYNDEKQAFERLVKFDLESPLYLDGHPARVEEDGKQYLYCGYTPPYAVRVLADLEHLTKPAAYEGYTCLVEGGRYAKKATKLERGPDGELRYGWKRDTPPLTSQQVEELIKHGVMKRSEKWFELLDVETKKPVVPHGGSMRWNEYRKHWIAIFAAAGGGSMIGETWYAEAETPLGPWRHARKIVTHDKYSFYNPVHHAFFDQEGGRKIYFEGTYTHTFSESQEKTPRYDYNQIMYRLDLADPRLTPPS
ncbi:MAG: hypothetical protein L0Y72_04970 [Gemmataceae bacterium]|nr:hypothetical protein [Gemmataceae bacterium]MCI0738374.1 hypothetical protein [Gemmataceae bacterium]